MLYTHIWNSLFCRHVPNIHYTLYQLRLSYIELAPTVFIISMSPNIILALNLSEKVGNPCRLVILVGSLGNNGSLTFPSRNFTKQNQTRCLLIRSLVVFILSTLSIFYPAFMSVSTMMWMPSDMQLLTEVQTLPIWSA